MVTLRSGKCLEPKFQPGLVPYSCLGLFWQKSEEGPSFSSFSANIGSPSIPIFTMACWALTFSWTELFSLFTSFSGLLESDRYEECSCGKHIVNLVIKRRKDSFLSSISNTTICYKIFLGIQTSWILLNMVNHSTFISKKNWKANRPGANISNPMTKAKKASDKQKDPKWALFTFWVYDGPMKTTL